MKYIHLVFLAPAETSQTLGISCAERKKGVFCYVNEGMFGMPLRIESSAREANPVIRRSELLALKASRPEGRAGSD